MQTTQQTQQIKDAITAAALAKGVDPVLALAVAHQESGFDPAARSGAGAIGLFQLMPATAAGLGVDPYDTHQNIEGGVSYLSQLLNRYDGNTALALAAYNAGPGNVAKYGGVPPFTETQNYVARIMAAIGLTFGSDAGSEPGSDPAAATPAGLSNVMLAAVGVIAASLGYALLRG